MTQFIVFLVTAPLAIVIAAITSVLAWRVRLRSPGAFYLAWCMVFITAFLAVSLIGLISPSQAGALFWAKCSYLVVSLIPVMWFAFTLEYSGHNALLRPRRCWVFLVIPILTNLFVQSDELRGLVWQSHDFQRAAIWIGVRVIEYGPWFWVHAVYSYGLMFTGALVLIFHHLRTRYMNGKQWTFMLLGMLLPALVNIAFVFKLNPQISYDFTATSLAVGGFFFFVSIYYHRMLDLVPYARSTLVERIRDGLIALDHAQRIVDINQGALGMLGLDECKAMGKQALDVMPFWKEMQIPANGEEVVTEIRIAYPGGDRQAEARIIHLEPTVARPAGYLVMMHDVTYYKDLLNKVVTMANVDPLTKIYNRRYFYDQAQRELERAHRYNLTMSVVLVDMDSLKKINDTFGHIVGDNLLVAIAQTLKSGAREVDTVARFGGDEFVLLLPLTGSAGAIQLMERLRHNVKHVPVEQLPGDVPHTISIGIVSLIGGTGLNFDEVLERADRAMYKSKLAGGDQITSVELEARRTKPQPVF